MRDYELVLLIRPKVTEEDLPETLEKVKQIIADNGGSITEMASWGRRKLAYPIAGASEATYLLMYLQLEPGRLSQLEANLQLTEDVLRHLLVRSEGLAPVKSTAVSGEESKESSNGQSE